MLVVHFWGPITGVKIPKTARIVEGTTANFRVVFGILKPVTKSTKFSTTTADPYKICPYALETARSTMPELGAVR